MNIKRILRAIKQLFAAIWDLVLLALWTMLIVVLIMIGIGGLQQILITFLGLLPFLVVLALLFVISIQKRREDLGVLFSGQFSPQAISFFPGT
ncbi:hypothetical protein F4775DRAFT_590861 [Biscogniauxia sp. FL1348]|nr:hypothetical protein F4775DRAFT_590861 [Biscogniauxia sp. FL1348]